MAGTIPMPAPGVGDTGAAPTPDDLLAQIRGLLDQYLAMGGATPVAPEAQALADAIDQSSGAMGGPDQGAPPPGGDMGAPPPPAGGDLAEPPPSDSKSYAGANVNALDRLKKRNKKQGQ